MCEQGFIKLSRKYFDNFLWNESRVYSKAEAWLDLIASARFEASTELINSRAIEIKRGEIPASRRFLEKRWGWGSTRVANFLGILAQQHMISQRTEQGQTILTLCKYSQYNNSTTTSKPPATPGANHRQTASKPRASQNKEYKNQRIQEKEDAGNATEVAARKELFYKELIPFTGQYPKVMVRAFFDYWSELNRAGKRMKFELEKTWETPRRLAIWAARERITTKKSNFANHNNNQCYEDF